MSNMSTSPIPVSNKPLPTKAQVISLHMSSYSNAAIAKQLGISKDTVRKILAESELGHRPLSIESTLAKAGITPDYIATKLREQVESNDVKLATWEGKFTDRLDVPDNNSRNKSLELAARMLGMIDDSSVNMAQLFVKLPNQVVTKGHEEGCTCDTCLVNWESQPIDVSPVVP